MEDKKITQDTQLIDDLREATHVIEDAKMKLCSLIKQVEDSHGDGSLSDWLYNKIDGLDTVYDSMRLSRMVMHHIIDSVIQDLKDQQGSDENE